MQGAKPGLATIQSRLDQQAGMKLRASTPPPPAPDWLDDDAFAEWDRIVPELAATYILKASDVQLLAAYCQTYATWKRMMLRIRADGEVDGQGRPHPCFVQCIKLAQEMRRFASEFGMSPSGRSKVKPEQPRDDEDGWENP